MLKTFFIFAISVILSSCQSTQIEIIKNENTSLFRHTQMEKSYAKADKLLISNHPYRAAKILWDAAKQLSYPHKQSMQMRASEILFAHHRSLLAYRYLIQIDETNLDKKHLLRKRINESYFYKTTDQYEKILKALPDKLVQLGDTKQRIRALKLKTYALTNTDYLVKAIEAHIVLNTLLDEAELSNNAESLWDILVHADPKKIEQVLEKEQTEQVHNWLKLAALATPIHADIDTLLKEFEIWKEENKNWLLSDSILEELMERWEYLSFSPQNVAIMLPLSGDYVQIGRTVRNGFMSEYNTTTPSFTVRFYNTDSRKSIEKIYQKAITQGADFIIGPLLKDNVKTLAQISQLDVQLITLNYLRKKTVHNNHFFQFGLLPEDEAIQVAQKVWGDGHRYILGLKPDNEWGKRLFNDFKKKYLELGGKIRQVGTYALDNVDYSGTIEKLFRLNESYNRYSNVSQTIDKKLKFTPRIRDDITATVMFANYERAILLYPQIKYHYADHLPVYSTSHIYTPNSKKKSRDLDGIYYLDAPIVFDYLNEFPEGVKKESLLRFFALGADAYHLINTIRYMNIGRVKHRGLTGTLSIKSKNRIYRQLKWVRIIKGKPVLLPSQS